MGASFGKANSANLVAINRFGNPAVLTTLASYRFFSNNIDRSLKAAADKPQVARETKYYLDNIENVKSVDDFLADDKLFNYAMKAWGLSDMSFAKAFMRKVLESDLGDSGSFVNRLSDKRYLDFAKAFNFLQSGDVDVGSTTAQDSASEDAMIGLYTEQRISKGQTAADQAAHYESRMASITSVDQLLADQNLFDYALTAYGIDPDIASVSAIRDVLTSDLSDPNSAANRFGVNYKALATAFSFETDGSVAPGGSAQTADQVSQTTLAYFVATDTEGSPAAAAFNVSHFNALMTGVTNVDDLVNNDFLRSFVVAAMGLDPATTPAATVRDVLVSDLSDPNSAANQSGTFKIMAQAFNFNTDGSLDPGVAAQTPAQATTLTNRFTDYYDDAASASDETATQYYRNAIGNVLHVDDLLADKKLYAYVLSSFGIDPNEVTKSKIKQALLSDPTNPASYVSLLRDSRFTKLASAFNFDSKGYPQGVKLAQTTSGAQNTMARYTSTLGALQTDQTLGKAESQYYAETIPTVSSVDQLLKDQRLKAYIARAYGLEDASDDTLRDILTSDPFDRRSFANASNNGAYKALAADFNFDSAGAAVRLPLSVAQDRSDIAETQGLYYRQMVEEDAGSQNEGVRLALYFDRKASSITSAYSILADKALLQVAQTALGLPQTMSLLDIDKQADLISKRLDVKDFQDPEKVQKFLTRFSAMWDVSNSNAAETSPAALLIGGTTTPGVSISLLSAIQNLKLGGR